MFPARPTRQGEQDEPAVLDSRAGSFIEVERSTQDHGGGPGCDCSLDQRRNVSQIGAGAQQQGPGAKRIVPVALIDDDVGDDARVDGEAISTTASTSCAETASRSFHLLRAVSSVTRRGGL
ncbi:hypothetical protein ACFCWG_30305 [Streptomyces sp. NPDC056390]|uniref:hypothetical protein n=1 Tax=Streptomyces sp. NPDC056390 TaxID=3345806 RepID=UPI0035E12251